MWSLLKVFDQIQIAFDAARTYVIVFRKKIFVFDGHLKIWKSRAGKMGPIHADSHKLSWLTFIPIG